MSVFPSRRKRPNQLRKGKLSILNQGKENERFLLSAASGFAYATGRTLNKSIYGQVVHAIRVPINGDELDLVHAHKKTDVAIKIYSKDKLREYASKTKENPFHEMAVLRKTCHRGIVKCLDCCQDSTYLYLVMEYFDGGDLFDVVKKRGRLTDAHAKSMVRQILQALSYLHQRGVSHRDISLENVLCDPASDRYVLTDFGMCVTFDIHTPRIAADGVYGKMNYIAPEVLRGDPTIDLPKVDAWSIGVLMFIALTGAPPFDSATITNDAYRMVTEGKLQPLLDHWGMQLEPRAVHLLGAIFNPNPEDRLSVDQILAHPWFSEPSQEH